MADRAELQRRIDELLQESVSDPPAPRSRYLDAATDVVDALWAEATAGDDAEIAAASMLDRAAALAVGANLPRVRHALEIVLTNHPRLNELGLRVPPLAERAPQLTLPSRRKRS